MNKNPQYQEHSITYGYAYNSKGELINIESLPIGEKLTETFTCISCGKRLTPKLGRIKIKHFAHHVGDKCSEETYLHKLGKKVFYDEYVFCKKNNMPFKIRLFRDTICDKRKAELKISCNLGKILTDYNLIDLFPEIDMEFRDGDFIPDIILKKTDGKKTLYFEIVVTHYASENKKSSNNYIIEFKINSESDLYDIKSHCISEDSSKTRFYNFKPQNNVGNICGGTCLKTYDFFFVYKNGASELVEKNLDEISQQLNDKRDEITYYEISELSRFPYNKYRYLIALSLKKKISVKSCYLCLNHKIDISFFNEMTPINCKKTDIHCNPNRAVSCVFFLPDYASLNQTLRDFKI